MAGTKTLAAGLRRRDSLEGNLGLLVSGWTCEDLGRYLSCSHNKKKAEQTGD